MALRNLRTGVLAVIAAGALAGCLPKEAKQAAPVAAEEPPPAPTGTAPQSPPPAPSQPVPTGTAALSWQAPLQYTDGSALLATELGAYRIYHGTSASNLQRVAEVDGRTMAFTVTDLGAGTHYFVVTAVTILGTESTYSDVRSKTIL